MYNKIAMEDTKRKFIFERCNVSQASDLQENKGAAKKPRQIHKLLPIVIVCRYWPSFLYDLKIFALSCEANRCYQCSLHFPSTNLSDIFENYMSKRRELLPFVNTKHVFEQLLLCGIASKCVRSFFIFLIT